MPHSQNWVAVVLLTLLTISMTAPATASSKSPSSSSTPLSLKHGIGKVFGQRWNEAKELAQLEQMVEDYNAEWIATSKSYAHSTSHRRLICLPLDDRFNPPMGQFSHDHVQTGDKMSLPKVFFAAIDLNGAEVPWLYSVKRVDGMSKERVEDVSDQFAMEALDEVIGGPLDFRAPSNYIFLPWWMMRSLGLQPRDVVDVRLVKDTPPGAMALLRPHSSLFAKNIANPQAVMETELRHYSALTKGSTIAFDYNGERYWFDVVQLRASPKNDAQPMVKVQDCNLATSFLRAKDALKDDKKKRQEANDDDDDDNDGGDNAEL